MNSSFGTRGPTGPDILIRNDGFKKTLTRNSMCSNYFEVDSSRTDEAF